MDVMCGDAGVKELLLRCSRCKIPSWNRYCKDAIIVKAEWLCSDCIPKHNEASKALEGATNQRKLRSTKFGSSIIKEPNTVKEKLTITSGLHRNREHQKRNDLMDESTKYSSSGDTSNRRRNGGAKGSHPMVEDKSHPTSARVEHVDILSVNRKKSEPMKAVKGLEKNVVASKFAPNRSNLVQRSHMKTRNAIKHPYIEEPHIKERHGKTRNDKHRSWNGDVLKPLKRRLDSWSRLPMQSSLSSELEDTVVLQSNAKRTRRLADEETIAPILKNRRSNPSMANERLVSNEGNSGEADRRSDVVLSSTVDKKMKRRTSVDREIVNSCKVNRISHPDSAQGDPNARITRMASYFGVKRMILKRMLREEGITISSDLLASKFVGPCESAKINPRKRKQLERYTPDGINYQKASTISENKNVNEARSNSSRPAPIASLRDCQNMPNKHTGSSGKVIGNSKKGKDKKMDKSWLARKASGGARKTAIVLALQASSLQRRSVEKSISYPENMDLALKEISFPLNNPTGSCAAQVPEISSTTKELRDCSKPKKRRRLILPYDEEEDAEDLHVVDLNSRSCDTDGHVRPHRKCVENAAKKNPRRYVEEDEEALRSENLNDQCSKYYKQMKRQRRIEANKDENESLRNLNAGCAKNDVPQLVLQTGVTEDHSGILRMPLIPESIGAQPLDKPYWTGIMKIDKNYIPLSAHLSTKAGKKVQELSRSLPPVMKVTKLFTMRSSPKHLEAPIPSADSIDLYFFSGDTRPNKELDQLLKHVTDSGIIIEAIVGLAKLCIFPSFVLPVENQTFQGKPYLWGVFNPRKDDIKRLAPVEQDCTANVSEEEEHVQEQHDQQNKARADTQDQVVHSEKQPLLGANQEVANEALSANVLPLIDMKAAVSADTSPADHGQPSSNPEALPPKLCGFVVSRTPRSVQLIQEMQKEGALLFAVQQVATEPGSLV